MTISRILGCENKTNVRPKDDFFQSPASATLALLVAERDLMPAEVWEPFVGKDAIGSVVEASGRKVHRTDLNDRGVGEPRVDFLLEWRTPCKAICSNPPFNLARPIIRHAVWPLQIEYMALLLKADFLHCLDGLDIQENVWRSARVYPLSWRLDFTGQKKPVMNCSWFVWQGKPERTESRVLARPHRRAQPEYGFCLEYTVRS